MNIGALRTSVKLCDIEKYEDINLKCSKDKQNVNTLNDDLSADDVESSDVDKKNIILKQGRKATVVLELVYKPGFFNVDDRIVLCESNVKIVGLVTEIM
jgi:hypothetical protein